METSPPPTPRKTVQRQHSRSSPVPVRRSLRPSSKPASRFATPAFTDRLSSAADNESVTSSMDVDGSEGAIDRILKNETVFARSPELQVTFYSHLPGEVKQVLRNADFYRDAYTGDVDTTTGFALVASAETCFVWKYTQALTGSPTCYIFSCPQDQDPVHMATPYHALVPHGTNREPGLILISPGGHTRFWDSLGIGLAGGDHYTSLALELKDEERVTTLTRADPLSYIVSTSLGRLFRLVLTSLGGRHQLSPRLFHRPQSSLSLSRLLPSFWSGDTFTGKSGNINAVSLENSLHGTPIRHVWTLIDFRVQRWKVSAEGWEELEVDADISDLIRPALRARFASASDDDSDLDLELLDIKFLNTTDLLLLVSYAGLEDQRGAYSTAQPRRIYAIITLQHTAESFQVKDAKSVPYQSTASSGAPTHPRLFLLSEGKVLVIQFGDTVALCAKDTAYMDRLELKSAKDRTLGVGIINGESELLVLTATTLMKTWVDTDAVEHFDPETGRANLVRNTMIQGILFGSYPENPLYFSFAPEIDEEALMAGAEKLSSQIIRSEPTIIRANHDLQAHMTNRKERLSFLIKFINDNAVITKISQRSRQKLATDAEKLYAAHQLWLSHNEILAAGNSHGVLAEAVYTLMNQLEGGSFEDTMRAFFRLHIDELGSLIPTVADIVRRSTHSDTQTLLVNLSQANNVVLTILQSALSYRQFNLGVYAIELPIIRPWTSRPTDIDIVAELFNTTVRWIEQPSADIEPARAKILAKEQLPELATALFCCYHEQLEWLRSPLAADEAGNERMKLDLEDKFRYSRPEILETLRRNGFTSDAFKLAENYRDFRSLASLCHKDVVYPPHDNPNAMRIQTYVDKFREEFTTELFQWYIEHGELRTMFAQDNGSHLDQYFTDHPHPNISWIHDVASTNYREASQSLMVDAEAASEIASKHLMLSIGKLAHLAQTQEPDSMPASEDILDAFHDGLDFVSVHQNLLDDLKSALAPIRTRQSLEMQADTIVKLRASGLEDRKALQGSFRQLVRRMLGGKALSVEDVSDVLSLKDNDTSLEDYVTALHLISREHVLPEARRMSALRTVWRRIYIHDDWTKILQTTNVTDAEVNERFRNTALCVAMQTTQPRHHVRPANAKVIPTSEEIKSRWPGVPAEEVDALYHDYEQERIQLDEFGLDEEVFERVYELASGVR